MGLMGESQMLLLFWASQGLNPPLCGNFAAEFTTRELGLLGSGAEMSYLISACTGGRIQVNTRGALCAPGCPTVCDSEDAEGTFHWL